MLQDSIYVSFHLVQLTVCHLALWWDEGQSYVGYDNMHIWKHLSSSCWVFSVTHTHSFLLFSWLASSSGDIGFFLSSFCFLQLGEYKIPHPNPRSLPFRASLSSELSFPKPCFTLSAPSWNHSLKLTFPIWVPCSFSKSYTSNYTVQKGWEW